jgi:hypothetical protein
MTPAQLRDRMIGALGSAYFAGGGWLFDCPLCGGKQDLHVAVYDSKRSGYLFNFANFCGCEQREVADEMNSSFSSAPALRRCFFFVVPSCVRAGDRLISIGLKPLK